MKQLELSDLFQFSLRKGAAPVVFSGFVEQFNHRQEIQVNEIKDLISSSNQLHPLKVVYIATASLVNQSTPFRIANIISSLENATELNQSLLLSAFISELDDNASKSFESFSHFEVNELISASSNYIKHLLIDRPINLLEQFATLLILTVPHLPHESLATISDEQNEVLSTFIEELRSNNLIVYQELERNLSKFGRKSSIAGSIRQSISSTQNNSTITHLSFLKSNKIPRYLWLSSLIHNWKTSAIHFLAAFEQFSRTKTAQNTLNELLSLSFEGYTIACRSHQPNSFFLYNWKLFILKRLPILIKSLNLKNLESSLTSAMNLIDPKIIQSVKIVNGNEADTTIDDMFASFPSTTVDIRHDFLRDCITLGLLSPSSFSTILKQDAAADSRPVPSINSPSDSQNITERLTQTLIDINPEFTSLEDSGLLDFLKSFTEMDGSKQNEASNLILQKMKKFIDDDDISQLYRLSLGLGLVKDALHVVLFYVSPKAFLKPLMNYLDAWEASSDEVNLQEAYSSFSGVFLLFLLIVKRFNISLDDLISIKSNPDKPSFSIAYISKLGSYVEIDPQDSFKTEVLDSWINALFDSGGISDELMRISTAQEYFDIFPNIFIQAFIGCKQENIDVEVVKGGLEYFVQPFLVASTVGIFAWSNSYLWRQQDPSLLLGLLKPLINPGDISGESLYLHEILLSIYGSDLYKTLVNVDKTVLKVDPQILLALRRYYETDSSYGFFEFGDLTIESNGESSILEIFHNSFYTLINWSQSSNTPDFDYKKFVHFIDLFGANAVIDYFIDQITISQITNSGKSFQLVLETSAFVLTSHFIGSSDSAKHKSLKSLKVSEEINDTDDLKLNRFLNALISKKNRASNDELYTEILKVFYDKVFESIETVISL